LKSKTILTVVHVTTSRRLMSRSARTFFGLTDEYIAAVYEQFFLLKYHGGWSFMEAYNLPIGLRNWFVERMQKQFQDEKQAMEKAQK
tara:strand:- start:309 stop:569 length:261 start_codon:yes stop_codon:yes gene_type:complete